MPKRSVGARGFVLAIALLGLAAGPAAAVGIVGSKLQVKPATKFQFQSKDPMVTPAGIDPTVSGATLTVTVNASTLTFNMPGGAACAGLPCWTGDTTKGWKYKNAAAPGAPGVVKIAQIKGAKLKVLTKGSMADAGGDFPLPATTDANAVLTSGATMYCAKFLLIDAAGHNDAVKGYLNKNPSGVTGSCAGGGTTTTTMPGGGTTTTTMPAAMCEAIVPAKAIPGKYSQTSVAGPNRCGFNAAANKGGLCANDGACGGTVGSCAATPWVTVGAIPAPQPSGTGSATFFNIAAADAQCKHQACIVCGNPNLACAGIPGCTGNPSCIKSTCCSTPGFQVPTLAINLGILIACTRVDQISCGDGEVNTSNPQTGDNEVKKVADTTDPGTDCVYGTGDDPAAKPCTTAAGGAGTDTKGKIVRTLGNGIADANGIHTRFRVPSLSTTWIENGDANCVSTSKFNAGDTFLAQLIINAEPTTAGATGQFSDLGGPGAGGPPDGCAAAGQAFGTNGNGPVSVGSSITSPEPYNASSGATTGTAATIFSSFAPTYDVGYLAITPVSAISLVSSTPDSCSCTITPGCPE